MAGATVNDKSSLTQWLNVEAVTGLDGYELTWRHDGKKLFITWQNHRKRRRASDQYWWTGERPRSGMFFGCAPGQVRESALGW